MKYFLAILLLFAVTCATVEEKYLDVDNTEDAELELNFKKIFKGIGGFFKGTLGKVFRGLKKTVQKAVKWLKDNNLWDTVVSKVKQLGKKVINGACSKYLKIQDDSCGGVVDFISDHVLKKN